MRKDISLIGAESAKVKSSKSILECPVSGCAECNPSNGACYYCMNGAKLIKPLGPLEPVEPVEPFEPSDTSTEQCKRN